MKYAYEELSPEQFEDVAIAICQFLLGAGCQGFATGPDGGRDAKFVGTAEEHPSKAEPWRGTTIIQAKHTNGYNKSFSDPDFFSEKTADTILGQELPRIKRLRAAAQVDHYILFSNRRLTANTESTLRARIANGASLPLSSVFLSGVEQLEVWLKRYPQAPAIAAIDPVDSPLTVGPDDLAEVVERLAEHLKGSSSEASPPVSRVSYEQKNSINQMSKEYGTELRKRYLKESGQIKSFLAAPENSELQALYEAAAEDFQLQILAKRKDHQSFDELFAYLTRLLVERDPVLRRNKRLTRAMVFYMYWNCDIGLESDA
ncbi:MAG: hypothetical protein OEZ06_31445 [Myxococcales bacterium]|nr:hypothetical protein [Myxococcales bacterium]